MIFYDDVLQYSQVRRRSEHPQDLDGRSGVFDSPICTQESSLQFNREHEKSRANSLSIITGEASKEILKKLGHSFWQEIPGKNWHVFYDGDSGRYFTHRTGADLSGDYDGWVVIKDDKIQNAEELSEINQKSQLYFEHAWREIRQMYEQVIQIDELKTDKGFPILEIQTDEQARAYFLQWHYHEQPTYQPSLVQPYQYKDGFDKFYSPTLVRGTVKQQPEIIELVLENDSSDQLIKYAASARAEVTPGTGVIAEEESVRTAPAFCLPSSSRDLGWNSMLLRQHAGHWMTSMLYKPRVTFAIDPNKMLEAVCSAKALQYYEWIKRTEQHTSIFVPILIDSNGYSAQIRMLMNPLEDVDMICKVEAGSEMAHFNYTNNRKRAFEIYRQALGE